MKPTSSPATSAHIAGAAGVIIFSAGKALRPGLQQLDGTWPEAAARALEGWDGTAG